ncbi:hypothetical protein TIFTF001_030224 [Ficus carica]|uniref:Uncharacterized protein n=1 Tax=Ficus carica TaxID=3494 RepID=A0AA88IZB4_FICCA|nr:hypothetical protein TIFTF001_030224 [Ficus carica]
MTNIPCIYSHRGVHQLQESQWRSLSPAPDPDFISGDGILCNDLRDSWSLIFHRDMGLLVYVLQVE